MTGRGGINFQDIANENIIKESNSLSAENAYHKHRCVALQQFLEVQLNFPTFWASFLKFKWWEQVGSAKSKNSQI